MTIETWFKKGAQFKWTQPDDVVATQDGTIVASPATASQMTFDSPDTRLLGQVDASAWSAFAKNAAVPHTWLCYIPGRTAVLPLAADVLTGPMSGCLIVQWVENGQRHVAHIGTVFTAAKTQPPNSTVKSTFLTRLNNLPAGEKMQVSGLNPALAWDYSEILPLQNKFALGGARIICLVTADAQFYSILLLSAQGHKDFSTVGGCKKCAPMGINLLTAALS